MKRTPILLLAASALSLSAQDPRLFAPSLARLKANDPKAAEDVKPGSAVERTALAPDLEKAPWARKVQASEWLLRAYIYKQRGQSPAPGAALAGAADPYLARAWKLLQGAESQAASAMVGASSVVDRNPSRGAAMPEQGRINAGGGMGVAERENFWMALEWIRLEVAWRMRSPQYMAEALKPYETRAKLDNREQLHAFMAAAHVGRWPLFLRLGEALSASGGLDRLKALALQDWSLPDYAGLFRQVQQAQPAAVAALPAAELRVRNLAMRLKSFSTQDPGLAEKLKASTGWTESGPVEVPLVRVGAVLHWLKPGAAPLPLVGAMTAEALRLEGSADQPLKGGSAWRKERYELKPGPEAGRWTGSLEVDQQALEGEVPAAQVFHLSFELRLDLEPAPLPAAPK